MESSTDLRIYRVTTINLSLTHSFHSRRYTWVYVSLSSKKIYDHQLNETFSQYLLFLTYGSFPYSSMIRHFPTPPLFSTFSSSIFSAIMSERNFFWFFLQLIKNSYSKETIFSYFTVFFLIQKSFFLLLQSLVIF